MKIKFLGTGGAFEPNKGNSSAIIERSGIKILIDCGYAVLERLIEKELVQDLDYILITHLHADHVGSLPTLLAYAKIIFDKDLPILFSTEAQKSDIHEFLRITWEEKRARYVSISELPWIEYVDTFGQHVADKQTFAYYFTEQESGIYYSGDLGESQTTADFIKNKEEANIIIFHDINKKVTSVHTYYKKAIENLKDYTVYGYHCDKATMPEDCILPLVEDYPELNY